MAVDDDLVVLLDVRIPSPPRGKIQFFLVWPLLPAFPSVQVATVIAVYVPPLLSTTAHAVNHPNTTLPDSIVVDDTCVVINSQAFATQLPIVVDDAPVVNHPNPSLA